MIRQSVKRYSIARDRVKSVFIAPLAELLEATEYLVAEERLAAKQSREASEALRPVWAQGWTSDSSAAQASAAALSELWQLLGAENQTAAMDKLRHLLATHDQPKGA